MIQVGTTFKWNKISKSKLTLQKNEKNISESSKLSHSQ